MAISKVVYSGNTLIDLTSDTVTPETLTSGVTAHDATGTPITGTKEEINLDEEITEQDSLIAQIQTALESKAGASGASVDTCTVTMAAEMVGRYGFTTYADGSFKAVAGMLTAANTTTIITNVVCGSLFSIVNAQGFELTYTNATEKSYIVGDLDGLYTSLAQIDAVAGGTVTIS